MFVGSLTPSGSGHTTMQKHSNPSRYRGAVKHVRISSAMDSGVWGDVYPSDVPYLLSTVLMTYLVITPAFRHGGLECW